MTFREEFPDFDPATMPEIPNTWTDTSWRNDMCPSFAAPAGWRVFIDYADPAVREFTDTPRFSVLSNDETVSFTSDNWPTVVEMVERPSTWWHSGECP